MQRLISFLLALLLLSGCSFKLDGGIRSLKGQTQERLEHDALYCKDKAKTEANTPGKQVGYFFLGFSIIGLPAAFAIEKSIQRSTYKECMEEKGYSVVPPQ